MYSPQHGMVHFRSVSLGARLWSVQDEAYETIVPLESPQEQFRVPKRKTHDTVAQKQ